MVTISWAITAYNEHVELKRLLENINRFKEENDEIVILLDKKYTLEVYNLVKDYNPYITGLDNDFAAFKNILKNHCTKDYIFFIDADEYLSDNLGHYIHELLELNNEVESYAVPRLNTVEGISERPDLIQKWGWKLDNDGYINYPDYQLRICKNIPSIEWVGKVHETLVGYKSLAHLPSPFDLVHPKTLERQEKQNNYYNTI